MKSLYTYISLCILSLAPASMAAQAKVNAEGMFMLKNLELERKASSRSATLQAPEVNAMVILHDSSDVERLESEGVKVAGLIDNAAIVTISLDDVERIAALDYVEYVDFGRKMQPMMDFARPASNVGTLQSGIDHNGTTMVFDGSGVVTGLMDVGIDPNHANFRNSDGSLRVKRVWAFDGINAGSYTTAQAISNFTTENDEKTHGTHVAGIMAGSYNGTGTYASQTAGGSLDGLTLHTSGNMPFYGVATNSDIAMAAGSLTTANILLGVKNVLDYAESVGKPAVVNLSLGSTSGPHDGTDYYSQKLAELGKRGIICMSAGNDGDVNMSASKTLTKSSPALKTFIANNTAEQGNVDIWSSGSEPLTVSWVIYDRTAKTTTTLLTCNTNTSNNYVDIIGTSNEYTQNADFNAAFQGYIALASDLDSGNNRYHVSAPVSVTPLASNTTKLLGIVIEGPVGAKINIYGTSTTAFDNNRVSGWTKGTPDESINDAAAAANVISVGSYNTRTCWGVLKQGYGVQSNGEILGDISSFSSYGTVNGENKPDICAPGAGIISSYSTPYTTANNIAIETNYSGSTTAYGRNSYFGQMQGTSMSCPHLSGIVALMLQADPSLDFAQVKEHLTSTAARDINVLTASKPIRWGAGKADALAAVKAVLDNRAAIGDVWADADERLIVTATADGYEVYMAGAADITATLYDLQGRPVASARGTDGTATVSASSLQSGIYILRASTPTASLSRKVTKN